MNGVVRLALARAAQEGSQAGCALNFLRAPGACAEASQSRPRRVRRRLLGAFIRITGTTALVGSALLAMLPLAARADPVADFYKGKTVRLLIGAGLGGSQDEFARLIARHLGGHIPGAPNVVPENMPGAGGVSLLGFLSKAAPRDGLTIGTAPPTTVFDPLFSGRSKGQFDPLDLQWLGGPVRFSAVAIAWNAATPIRTARDLLKVEMKVGATSAASASATDSYVLRNLLGFKYDVVLGYPGGADIDLAMVRGETQGRANVAWDGLTSRNPDWIRDGKISLLYQEGLRKNPEIPANVPLVLDFAKTPADRQMLELKFSSYEIAIPYDDAEHPARSPRRFTRGAGGGSCRSCLAGGGGEGGSRHRSDLRG